MKPVKPLPLLEAIAWLLIAAVLCIWVLYAYSCCASTCDRMRGAVATEDDGGCP